MHNNTDNNESTKSAEPLWILYIDHSVVVLHMHALIIDFITVTLPAIQLVTLEESITINQTF